METRSGQRLSSAAPAQMVESSVHVLSHQSENESREFTLESCFVLPIRGHVDLEEATDVGFQDRIQQGRVDVHVNAIVWVFLNALNPSGCESDAAIAEAYTGLS